MSSSPPNQDLRLDVGGFLILWGTINPAATDENDLNDWWTNEHLPERIRLPGFQRARRYCALEADNGQHEHLACYEASDVEDCASPEYLHALDNSTTRTKQFMPYLAAMQRSACTVRTFAPFHQASNALILVVLHSAHAVSESVVWTLRGGIHRYLLEISCIQIATQAHIAVQDEQVTKVGSTSRSYDRVHFTEEHDSDQAKSTKKYIALFELNDAESIFSLDKKELSTVFDNEHFHAFVEHMATLNIYVGYRNAFQLISSLAKSDMPSATSNC